MKKLFLCLSALILIGLSSYSQNVQTKTVNIRKGVTKTYSYYLDKNGNEILHGKFLFVMNENTNTIKGTETLTCSYKDGKLNGLLTFKSNVKTYHEKVQVTEIGIKKVWVEDAANAMKEKPNFSVQIYEGTATGDINFTYRGLNYKGIAKNGILIDGTEFIINDMFLDGRIRNRVATYENLNAVNDSSNLQHIPAEEGQARIAIQYSEPDYVVFDLPFFVDKDMHFDKLGDIIEYQNFFKNKPYDFSKKSMSESSPINKMLNTVAQNYNLSDKDKETVVKKVFEALLNNEITDWDWDWNSKDIFEPIFKYYLSTTEIKNYYNSNVENVYNKYEEMQKVKQLAKENIEKEFKLLYNKMESILGNRDNRRYVNYITSNRNAKIPQEIKDLLENRHTVLTSSINKIIKESNDFSTWDTEDYNKLKLYLNALEENNIPAIIDSLDVLKNHIDEISKKVLSIENMYSSQKDKILYSSYIECVKSFTEMSSTSSISELSSILNNFNKICSNMLNKEMSKKIKKELKLAKMVDEKIKILIQ